MNVSYQDLTVLYRLLHDQQMELVEQSKQIFELKAQLLKYEDQEHAINHDSNTA